MYYGAIDNFTISKANIETPKFIVQNKTLKEHLRVKVSGKQVSFIGFLPKKQLLIMDAQGCILHKLQTEPSMTIDLPNAGKYVIWYENEARIVTIW